jgi:hypothetical protein
MADLAPGGYVEFAGAEEARFKVVEQRNARFGYINTSKVLIYLLDIDCVHLPSISMALAAEVMGAWT